MGRQSLAEVIEFTITAAAPALSAITGNTVDRCSHIEVLNDDITRAGANGVNYVGAAATAGAGAMALAAEDRYTIELSDVADLRIGGVIGEKVIIAIHKIAST